jgi:uncharacterized membrane protein YraQ (UPF0718 family)
MIEGILSWCVYYIQTVFQILLPLLPWLAGASLLTVGLERVHWERLQPAHPLKGALLGILSPLPTIAAISLLRSGGRGQSSFLAASLLLNPVLWFLIAANLGWKAALVYTLAVLLIAYLFGLYAQPARISAETSPATKKRSWLQSVWRQICYIGFFSLIGVLIAALLRNLLSWTFYNVEIISIIPIYMRPLLLMVALPGYQCGGAWLPILDELNGLGLNQGFALGFVLMGQAVRPGHLMALSEAFSKKTLQGFLITVVFGSLIFVFFV